MYLLIAACVLVFFHMLSLASLGTMDQFVGTYGVIPAQFTGHLPSAGTTPLPLRLVTSLFLHGGWLHLAGNMLFLWIFADNVEGAMGHGSFLAFYLLCGVIANLAHVIANPLSTEPAIGASGAIAGVLGGYLLLYPRARVLCLVFLGFFLTWVWVPAILFLPVWVLLQLAYGVASLGVNQSGGVAWWAHVGGFASGVALVHVFARQDAA